MKMPWQDKTGLAKATATLATGFCISLGLCGINFLVFAGGNNGRNWFGTLLIATGFAEAAGIVVFGGGMVIVALIYIGQQIYRLVRGSNSNKEEQ